MSLNPNSIQQKVLDELEEIFVEQTVMNETGRQLGKLLDDYDQEAKHDDLFLEKRNELLEKIETLIEEYNY